MFRTIISTIGIRDGLGSRILPQGEWETRPGFESDGIGCRLRCASVVTVTLGPVLRDVRGGKQQEYRPAKRCSSASTSSLQLHHPTLVSAAAAFSAYPYVVNGLTALLLKREARGQGDRRRFCLRIVRHTPI